MPPNAFRSFSRVARTTFRNPRPWSREQPRVILQPVRGPSRFSQSLAVGIWRTSVALSLLPPAYLMYLLKQRFWPQGQVPMPSVVYSWNTVDPSHPAIPGVDIHVSSSENGFWGIRQGRAYIVRPNERFEKAKTTLTMLDDAGVLPDLERRWREREAEDLQQRKEMLKSREE